MNVADIARRRYTTKAFDASRKISDADMAQISEVLRCAPSSVNSQPWHFIIAASEAGKAQVAQGMQGTFAYNAPKVNNASHVVVLCARETLDDAHLSAVVGTEDADGRFATPDARATQDKTRRFYVNLHQNEWQDEQLWMDKQVYIVLGSLLFAAGALNIDACPMEGFDAAALDAALDLKARGLRSVLVVALGYRSAEDFNAKLPKSRLPAAAVISEI